MTAQNDDPNSDDKMPLEPEATGPAAPDQVDDDATATPSATPTEDSKPEEIGEPPSRKKSAKPTSAKKQNAKHSQARKDAGAYPRHKKDANEQAANEEAAKTADNASSDGTPHLRCLKVIREAPPVLPSGILPPEIDKVFPDPASRGALGSALLSAVAAAAGHAVGLAVGHAGGLAGGREEGQRMLGLRIAVISDTSSLISIIAPVLQATYAVQADETKTWMAAKQTETGQAAVTAVRQRLYRQTVANAAILGIDGLGDAGATPTAMPAVLAPRPCFVMRDPVPTAVEQGLANASKGALIIDGTKMPTLAGWGTNFLTDLADLLNAANAGELLELADPLAHGAVRMRCACVSVIGMLKQLDTFGLYKAKHQALASTLFVPIEAASKTIAANVGKVLMALLARLRVLEPEDEGNLRRLRLSAEARKSLEQMKRRLNRAASEALPPLGDVYAGAADLALRIAALLHLLDYAAGGADQLPTEIENAVMQRTADFVEQYALPAARSVLGPASVDPAERDARRVLSVAQQEMAPEDEVTEHKLLRHLRRGMGKMELKQAIRLLIGDGLLSPKTPGGGQIYVVDPLAFAPENRLPDLVSDPRRPRQ